ncbi:hypothetical protein [Micromonospora humi]|uniref:Uncharacterized protein n=1 Tax=Micromonospora humi TaxID=745366 RepID=A0A1C5K8Y4_9ACTN|nr:hypothetical protein [Micromonospora humi]SCG79265.1 hypothetical protein GA0070213_12535 [Micromonospora humi]
MLAFLFIVVLLLPVPLLATVVLAVRLRGVLRQGGARRLTARARAAWRNGTRRPVWPGLIAIVVAVALLTAGLERLYLATVTSGSRWASTWCCCP